MTVRHPIYFLLIAGLSLAFFYYGERKLTSDPRDVAIYTAIGFAQWPRYITGSVEVLCAAALWLPATRLWAALGLVATMCIGTTALVVFAGLPYWHLTVLGAFAMILALLELIKRQT